MASGRESFAVLVVAGIAPSPAAASVLIEQIGGERGGIAGAAADDIAQGFAERTANQVEARDFDGGECARAAVGRILAGNVPRLAAFAAGSGF